MWLATGGPPTWAATGWCRGSDRPGPRLRGRGRDRPSHVPRASTPRDGTFIGSLAADGLDGIECDYGRYSPDLRAVSPFDGRPRSAWPSPAAATTTAVYKPDLALGTGLGDLVLPTTCWTRSKPAAPEPAVRRPATRRQGAAERRARLRRRRRERR